jgi:NADH:ubiquinone oxidoreductase subunit
MTTLFKTKNQQTTMATLGTLLSTFFTGRYIGSDNYGNRYYEEKHGTRQMEPKKRRWVVYKGKADASKVPPAWHGWLHYITNDVPTSTASGKIYSWEKDPVPNLTGTQGAYFPPGHKAAGGIRSAATGDYEAWRP